MSLGETLVTTGLAFVSGEISLNKGWVDVPQIVRDTITDVGYTDAKFGLDGSKTDESLRQLPIARRKTFAARSSRAFWAGAAALALSSRFPGGGELPECGPNLLLLALSWSAVYLWVKDATFPAGMCLGSAIADERTPGLFR